MFFNIKLSSKLRTGLKQLLNNDMKKCIKGVADKGQHHDDDDTTRGNTNTLRT